jgi:anthranilate phosphoribosyltransferase
VRDAVIINAAAALVVSGKAADMEEGADLAGESIDSGKALGVLEAVRSLTAVSGSV